MKHKPANTYSKIVLTDSPYMQTNNETFSLNASDLPNLDDDSINNQTLELSFNNQPSEVDNSCALDDSITAVKRVIQSN